MCTFFLLVEVIVLFFVVDLQPKIIRIHPITTNLYFLIYNSILLLTVNVVIFKSFLADELPVIIVKLPGSTQ